MNGIVINNNKIILELSQVELEVISSALTEVCNSFEAGEFETRMGVGIEEARNILETLSSICIETNLL